MANAGLKPLLPAQPSLLTDGGDAGLYVHVPFCSAICPYCDFAVTTGGEARRARFVQALLAEIGLSATSFPFPIDTIYFGGGTPSLLAPDQLEAILNAARASLAIRHDAWISLEANPEDVRLDSLRALRALRVRSLSLGVQSFTPERLRFLGRRHDPDTAARAIALAREADLDTISIDIIYGLPDDDWHQVRADLDRAIALAPDHLSCYQLSLPDGTPFGRARERGTMIELGDDAQSALFVAVHDHLKAHGYEPYEVSNFARAPEHRSRHNQKYWRHVPYLGLGPGAHSFDGTSRWWNERAFVTWEKRLQGACRPLADSETLTPRDLALESLMLALRTREGLDLIAFETRFGIDLMALNSLRIDDLRRSGRIEVTGSRLRPTTAGLAVADAIARDLAFGTAFPGAMDCVESPPTGP